MRRIIILISFVALCDLLAQAARPVRVVVENSTNRLRHEVVEVDVAQIHQQLGVDEGEPFIVRNAFGQEVCYQLSYNQRMLLEVSVRPHAIAAFTVEQGTPSQGKSYVGGRQYPERKDDMAWENDR